MKDALMYWLERDEEVDKVVKARQRLVDWLIKFKVSAEETSPKS